LESDALRLKTNFAYCLHQCKTQSFEVLVERSKAVLEHLFDNHDHCGNWCSKKKKAARVIQSFARCKVLKIEGAKLATKKANAQFFRDKAKNKKLYEQLSAIVAKFICVESLKQVHHQYNTNKCEMINNQMTRFAPKNKHYAKTIVGKARAMMAIGVDSVGMVEFFCELAKVEGIKLDTCTLEELRRQDSRKETQKRIHSSKKQKQTRAKKKRQSILDEKAETFKDKKHGRTYKSGMAVPDGKRKKSDNSGNGVKQCSSCGVEGHTRRSSKHCLKNPLKVAATIDGNDNEEEVLAYVDEFDDVSFCKEIDEENDDDDVIMSEDDRALDDLDLVDDLGGDAGKKTVPDSPKK
jgi:hypothetical protein